MKTTQAPPLDVLALRRLPNELRNLSNEELRDCTRGAARATRVDLATLLAHLGELDSRELYVDGSQCSIHFYAKDVLGFTRGEADRRISAARVSAEYPAILELIAEGELRLTGVNKLKAVLRPDNADALLQQARGMTVAQLDRLLISRASGEPQDASSVEVRRPRPEAAARVSVPDPVEPTIADGEGPTLTQDVLEKLETVRALLRTAGRDLSASETLEEALDLLIEREEERAGDAGAGSEDGGPPPAPPQGIRTRVRPRVPASESARRASAAARKPGRPDAPQPAGAPRARPPLERRNEAASTLERLLRLKRWWARGRTER